MISVKEDNLLSVNIGRGLILAECLPINQTKIDQKPAVLFKAEFSNLSGSGKIKLASTADKTGNYSLNLYIFLFFRHFLHGYVRLFMDQTLE